MCTDGIVLNVGRSLQCELIKNKYEGKNTLKARNNTSGKSDETREEKV